MALVFMFAIGKMTNAFAYSSRDEATVPKTFNQMVDEALAEVPTIKPEDAHQMMQTDPDTLVVDVRDPHFSDISRPIITTCEMI